MNDSTLNEIVSAFGYPATHVADWFLARATFGDKDVSLLVLHKLIYVAHGWHLAILDVPLVNEPIRAFRWGPAVASLHSNVDRHDGSVIRDACSSRMIFHSLSLAILERVWEIYGDCSFTELTTMTTRPGTPWSKHYSMQEVDSKRIPNDDIRWYYSHQSEIEQLASLLTHE